MRAGWGRPARPGRRGRRALAGLALVAAPAWLADAQEAPDGAATVLPPITVEGQAAAPSTATIGAPPPAYAGGQVARGSRAGLLGNRDSFDTPFRTFSFTDELARERQAQSPADLLRYDPAASVFYSPSARGSVAGTILSLRGFEVPASSAQFNGLPGLMSRSETILPFSRLEVIAGASALLTGQVGNVGGTINYVPKRADDVPLTLVTGRYEALGNAGLELDVGRRFGRDNAFGARFNGGYRRGEIGVEDSTRENQLASLALDYSGERLRLSADLSYDREITNYDNPVSFAPGFDIPDPPDAGKIYSQRWSESDQEALRGVLAGEFDLSPNWTIGLAGGAVRRDWFYVYPNLLGVEEDGDYATVGNYFRSVNDSYSGEASLRGAFNIGSTAHELAATATWTRSIDGYRSFDTPVIEDNIFDPVYRPRPELRGIGNVPDRFRDETRTVAIADVISILDERVSLVAGVRHTRIKNKTFDDTASSESRNDEDAVTPGFGLIVKPLPSLALYGNYIEALEPGGVAPLTTENAGEAFAPFRSEQYEVGMKLERDGLGATLALFQIERPSAFIDPDTNRFSQDGEQRNRGVELTVFGEPLDGVRLLGGYSLIDAELIETADPEDEGGTAPGVPRHRVSLTSDLDVPGLPGLTLTGSGFYTSRTELTQDSRQDVPAFTTFDAGARYQTDVAARPVTLRFMIENVTDNDHWVGTTFGGFATLGGPRRFLLSGSVEF